MAPGQVLRRTVNSALSCGTGLEVNCGPYISSFRRAVLGAARRVARSTRTRPKTPAYPVHAPLLLCFRESGDGHLQLEGHAVVEASQIGLVKKVPSHLLRPSSLIWSLRVVRPRDIEPAHLVLQRGALQAEASGSARGTGNPA